jgi:hypothetical protein
MAEIVNSLSLSLQNKLKAYYFNEFQKNGECSTKSPASAPSSKPISKETFIEAMPGYLEKLIANENQMIQDDTDEYYRSTYANESLVKYQYEVYDSLSFLNTILFMLYVLLFIFILVMLLKQYMYNVPRNIYLDSFLVILMAIYPFIASTIEIYLYRFIKYIFSGIVVFGYAVLRLFQRNI